MKLFRVSVVGGLRGGVLVRAWDMLGACAFAVARGMRGTIRVEVVG